MPVEKKALTIKEQPPQRQAAPAAKPQQQRQTQQQSVMFNHDVRTILEWSAPGRPFKVRSKEYYVNALLITLAVEIIIFLFHDYLLMVVVIALVFLSFALSIVPPRAFYYRITTEGMLIEDHFLIWDELYDFYFLQHHGQQVLHVRTKAYFPGELLLTLGELEVEKVKKALLPFLPYREYVEPTFIERAGDWLDRNFPLEKSS